MPSKKQTLPEDQEPMIEVLQKLTRSDWSSREELISDVLADLRHLCDRYSLSFHEIDRVAYGHYLFEKQEQQQDKRRKG